MFVASQIVAASNRATNGPGGALLLEATRGSLLLDGLSASGNAAEGAASGSGGAVAVYDTRHQDGVLLYVSSSWMYNNTAAGVGGAMWLDGSRTHQQVRAHRSVTFGGGWKDSCANNVSLDRLM